METQEDQAFQGTKKIRLTLFTAGSVSEVTMFIYISMMPFVYKKYDIDMITFGYIQSIYALLQMCLGVLIGRAGDVFGARFIMLLAAVSEIFAHLSIGLAGGLMSLILSRSITLFHDIMPGLQMLMTDITLPEERGHAFGQVSVSLYVGKTAGPLIGGFLAAYFGVQGLFLCTWIAPALLGLFIWLKIPRCTKSAYKDDYNCHSAQDRPNLSKILNICKSPMIATLLAMKLLLCLPLMALHTNMTVALMTIFNATPQTSGLLTATTGILGVVMGGLGIGYLSRSFHDTTLIKSACVGLLASWVMMSRVSSITSLIIAHVPLTLSSLVVENQVTTSLTKTVPNRYTGTVLGIGQSLFHFSRTLAPAAGTIIISKLGFSTFGQLGSLLSIPLTFLAWFVHSKKKSNTINYQVKTLVV